MRELPGSASARVARVRAYENPVLVTERDEIGDCAERDKIQMIAQIEAGESGGASAGHARL